MFVTLQRSLYVPIITNHTSHYWWMPNVVVAHLSEGIEAVHLATGRTVCKVSTCHWSSSNLWYVAYPYLSIILAKLAVDFAWYEAASIRTSTYYFQLLICIWVVAVATCRRRITCWYQRRWSSGSRPGNACCHPSMYSTLCCRCNICGLITLSLLKCQAFGGNGARRDMPTGMMEPVKPCWAVATSGVPVREYLFNGSICRHSPYNSFQPGDFGRSWGRTTNTAPLEVATPILIPRQDGHRHRKGSFGDVVFLTSRGEVSQLFYHYLWLTLQNRYCKVSSQSEMAYITGK